MSSQNRFLLPHSANASSASSQARANQSAITSLPTANSTNNQTDLGQENHLSVDTDFDSYWEEEARNPHRNRIRIGRQYQATVPPLLKQGERDIRKLDELETLSFCPKKSACVSDAELDHYFTVAKSLNLFASLVETRSLLGRDVTIADLNRIRHKEGLSLASVIQPPPRHASTSSTNTLPLSSQHLNTISQQSPQKSPPTCDRPSSASRRSPARDQLQADNQPLMKALSHFISLHHPCHHDPDCKKLLKDIPYEEESTSTVSITAGNLRQGSSTNSKEAKPGRSRSSLKQTHSLSLIVKEDPEKNDGGDEQIAACRDTSQSPSFEDWTREEVEMFSRAIEVCGKNFGSIKKEFLPSKSVKSIVEYYYIGSRDVSDSKKKTGQPLETNDGCSSQEKPIANNNSQGGGTSGEGSGSSTSGKTGQMQNINSGADNASSSRTASSANDANHSSSTSVDPSEGTRRNSPGQSDTLNKASSSSKNTKANLQDINGAKIKSNNIDPRMSVYNFDEELKDEQPMRFECPRPGAEVKPLKAKPIIPSVTGDSEATNSNVGSLKFFMDGQLVLKLNACQEQQEGIEKFHWVQSGAKATPASRQKRYTKKTDRSSDSNQNGSQSNSVVSSFQDDDSKLDDLSVDEDSKESMNSFTNLPHQKNHHLGSPTTKRAKVKGEPQGLQPAQLPSPINYNRLAVNNSMKERNDSLSASPAMSQPMPWLQTNASFAMAAALLGGLHFPQHQQSSMMDNSSMQNSAAPMNMASKPMDLSLEHSSSKTFQKTPTSRSRSSKSKNN